jgi:hypothetical protein
MEVNEDENGSVQGASKIGSCLTKAELESGLCSLQLVLQSDSCFTKVASEYECLPPDEGSIAPQVSKDADSPTMVLCMNESCPEI